MRKLSSYQKLKRRYDEVYELYYQARKRLHDLGEGVDGNDLLLDFDVAFTTEDIKRLRRHLNKKGVKPTKTYKIK